MKYLLLLSLFASTVSFSQSAKEIWKPILQDAEVAKYFSGMWESLGITVMETGEKLTVVHEGDHFTLNEGIDLSKVDYDVVLVGKSVKDMGFYGEDGKIDTQESFKIMGTLFTPFVRASMQHPMMKKEFQMNLVGLEKHVHVYLEGPSKGDIVTHTMIFINKEWMVIEGIHGNAKRVFEISVDDAIDYQRVAFKAKKEDSRKSWKAYKKFYLKWRKNVSYNVEDRAKEEAKKKK